MPSYKTVFPSKYIKATDLGATRPIGTIADVDLEDVGTGAHQERKLVVRFEEPTIKPLVLNLINSNTIAKLAGTDDYEQWPGTRVQLFAATTEFQAQHVPCVRICAPTVPRAKTVASRATATAPPEPPHPADLPDAERDPDSTASASELDDIAF